MRILIANLKLFYRFPILWVASAWFVISGYTNWYIVSRSLSLDVRAENIWPVTAMVFALAAGLIIGAMLLRIVLCPVSFCLPGHLVATRRLLFLVGVSVSYVASVVFVRFVDQDGFSRGRLLLALCAAFSASLTLYLIGAIMSLGRVGLRIASLLVMALWIGLGVLGLLFSPLLGATGRVIVHFPVLVIVLGAIAATKVWLWMDRPCRLWTSYTKSRRPPVRVLPDGKWYSVDIRFFPATLNRALQELIEAAFLRGMRCCEGSRLCQYSLGAVYTTLLYGLTHRWILAGLVLLFSFALVMSACFPIFAVLWIISMSLILANAVRHAPPCSYAKPLINAGRRERLWATLAVASVMCCFCMLQVLLLAVAMRLFDDFLPDMLSESPTGLSLYFVLFPLVCFPVAGLLELVSYRRNALAALSGMLPVAPIWLDIFYRRDWFLTVSSAYVLGAAALAWLVFGWAVRRVALRTDLWSPWPGR